MFRLGIYRQLLSADGNKHCVSHTECRMGQWYYANTAELGHSSAFRAIEAPHTRFHECGSRLFAALKNRDIGQASSILDAMDKASQEVFHALEVFSDNPSEARPAKGNSVELF
nr:CZB domain-containing protein [Denitratisoma oestradiolicum]